MNRSLIVGVILAVVVLGGAFGVVNLGADGGGVSARGGWTLAQFKFCRECSPATYYWSAGSANWYGEMSTEQTVLEYLETIPSECPVEVMPQDGEYFMVFFPRDC